MQQEIQVRFPEELQGGRYANNATIAHTQEEFVLDFIFAAPPVGAVNARVIISPGHMKRIIAAMQDNLAKYEASYGKIKATQEPQTGFGFIQ